MIVYEVLKKFRSRCGGIFLFQNVRAIMEFYTAMKAIIWCFCICISVTGVSQNLLKGIVQESETKTPVAGASVFLSNTSIGTVTNNEGKFELALPAGRYNLVVSSIGYQTFSQVVITTAALAPLTIALQPKASELENVVVAPFEPDGWATWGTFLIENFIGTSGFAKECVIKNTNAIKFRNSKKTGELTAIAFEPLLIQNKALGYTIRYQLQTFSYNFNTGYLLYEGFPFFEPMAGGAARQKRWVARRKETYQGSMLQFMRSVYRNKIAETGFEMRALKKTPNNEKKRIQTLYTTGSRAHIESNKDSTAYYEKVAKQPDQFETIGKTTLSGDSVAYAIDSVTAGLDFTDYLLVIYKGKTAPPEYQRLFPRSGSALASQLFLFNNRPIAIQANGSFYEPSDVLSIGYWSWWEKIATMLPFDYKPD